MQNLSDKMGDNQFADIKATCMDCEKDFVIKAERTDPTTIIIIDGVIGKREGEYLFKCNDCYKKDKSFGQKTEVYSRVVGYLRPVSHWNEAKQQEFAMRKTYKEENK